MQESFVAVFLMLATAACVSPKEDDNSQFVYDYESLKVAGLIMAGILCAMGIIILLSGKCRCKFNKKSEQRHRAQEQQLIAPGCLPDSCMDSFSCKHPRVVDSTERDPLSVGSASRC